MKKKLKNISKLLLVSGCVSLIAYSASNAAPLTYDMNEPAVRTDYNAPNKIRLEGDVSFNDNGQKINLSLRNTDVQQVLRMFADKAGLNIIFHSTASGTVTLDLVDVSLEEAFKLVMKISNLTYVIKDNTMMVVGTSAAEKLNLTKDNITILPVKYVDAAYLAQFLNTNIFGLNTPGLSYGPIVTTNAEKNELLIFGTDNDYQMAKKIVERFDKKPLMTTYRVNHTTPYAMAKMICETLFQMPEIGGKNNNQKGGGTYTSQLSSSFKLSGEQKTPEGSLGGGSIACTVKSGVSTGNISSYQAKPTLTLYVQPDLGTLTMVGGTEQQIQMVNDFIIENDRKQPQAYLEVSIISLTEDGSKTFNNSWQYTGKHLNLTFDGTSGFKTQSPLVWHGPSNSNSVKSLTQTLTMLVENKKGRLLANPKIVLTNGQKSVIDLTQDYIESTTVQIISSSTGQASNNVQKTYEIGEDNGIKVEITPFISPDGYVSLTMKPDYASVYKEITDVYMDNPYIAATLLQRHNLDLKNVRIKDEETLLLGGMITETEQNNTSKIPILGDIPVIGALFRNQTKTMKKEELLILMTPRIIKDTEDVAEL